MTEPINENISQMNLVETNGYPDKTQELQSEIQHRFGILPNMFRLPGENAEITAGMWNFAQFAYLDVPLPSLFKERLFVYLSRFSGERYCITRHIGFLTGLGHPSGDHNTPAQPIQHVIKLLQHPLPRQEKLDSIVEKLNALQSQLTELPEANSSLEEAVFACAAHVFLQSRDASKCLNVLRKILHESHFQYLLVFLTFIRTAHYWSKVQTGLHFEDDIEHLLATSAKLSEVLMNDPEAIAFETRQALLDELESLRLEKKRGDKMLHAQQLLLKNDEDMYRRTSAELVELVLQLQKANEEIQNARRAALNVMEDAILSKEALEKSEAEFRAISNAAPGFVWICTPSGENIFFNERWYEFTGQTKEQAGGYGWTNAVHPEDRQRLAPFWERCQETGEICEGERRYRHHSGEYRWHVFRALPRRNANGKIEAWYGLSIDIHSRKQAEEALRQSEESFRTLTDAVPQVIWSNDESGKANYFNRRWYEYSGLSYEESYGLGWEAIVHPKDAPASIERWQKAFSAGEIFDIEYRLRRADGIYRWHIGRNVPLKNSAGKILGWFGSATDIETLKKAEEDVRASEQEMRVTMESATDYAIMTLDTEGRIRRWSTGAQRIFGYNEHDVIDKKGDFIFTPEDRAAGVPAKEMKQAREKGRAVDERWHLRKDGSRFFMSGVMAPIKSGTLAGYVKVARDMTESKAAEQALKLSEERYRVALKSAEMGAWDWNVVTDKVAWNEQHYIMLGLQPQDTENDSAFFTKFVHPDDVTMVSRELKKAVEETGIYQAEFRIIRSDGKIRWMNGYGRAVSKDGKRATRIVGVMYDVTERKLLEQQKDEFIGIASHELKTPVTSIKGYAQVLQEMFIEADNKQSADLMHKLDVQVDRLTGLIRLLLDTTKISEGQLILYPEQLDLNLLITEQLKDLQYFSKKHQLVFKPGKIKSIMADKERIGQVITNLVTNAIKYSPKGGEVLITSKQLKSNIKVSVHDNGIGIAPELHSKVFDRFFRAGNSSTDTFPGMGLGLYVSAGIIHRHGGTISVKSTPGEGSEFFFLVPNDRPAI